MTQGNPSANPDARVPIKEPVLERVFDAPRDLVFKAWTEPRHVAQWWGPHGFTNPVCELDPRPGGEILIHMQWPDGKTVNVMRGTYREVVAPECLVFISTAYQDDGGEPGLKVLNTVTFADENGKTRMTLHAAVLRAVPEMAAALAGMEQGWSESLERLNGYVVSTHRRGAA
jgi:uncharacterized protein YndB with AHSA1/START domain